MGEGPGIERKPLPSRFPVVVSGTRRSAVAAPRHYRFHSSTFNLHSFSPPFPPHALLLSYPLLPYRSAPELAKLFTRANVETIEELLQALATLGQARRLRAGKYTS